MVVAQIGVRQHIVADALGRAQAAAMADHQPRFGAEYRKVIGNRLGVGRADADIDQTDSLTARCYQVIGRHLVPPPGAVGDQLGRVRARSLGIQPARARQCGIAPLTDLTRCPANEFIDIAMVVGEQYEFLEMLGRRTGIMPQPCQTEIGAQRIEQRQRACLAGVVPQRAVGQLITDERQLGRGKMPRQILWRNAIQRTAGQPVEHIGEGDFLCPLRHLEPDIILLADQPQLLAQIGFEQIGPGDRRGIIAGFGQPPERDRTAIAMLDALITDA